MSAMQMNWQKLIYHKCIAKRIIQDNDLSIIDCLLQNRIAQYKKINKPVTIIVQMQEDFQAHFFLYVRVTINSNCFQCSMSCVSE